MDQRYPTSDLPTGGRPLVQIESAGYRSSSPSHCIQLDSAARAPAMVTVLDTNSATRRDSHNNHRDAVRPAMYTYTPHLSCLVALARDVPYNLEGHLLSPASARVPEPANRTPQSAAASGHICRHKGVPRRMHHGRCRAFVVCLFVLGGWVWKNEEKTTPRTQARETRKTSKGHIERLDEVDK